MGSLGIPLRLTKKKSVVICNKLYQWHAFTKTFFPESGGLFKKLHKECKNNKQWNRRQLDASRRNWLTTVNCLIPSTDLALLNWTCNQWCSLPCDLKQRCTRNTGPSRTRPQAWVWDFRRIRECRHFHQFLYHSPWCHCRKTFRGKL